STGVTLSRLIGSDDLALNILATGKTVTLRGEFNHWSAGLTIQFADGVSWTAQDVAVLLAGSTVFYGTSGADLMTLPADGFSIDAGGGDDTLSVSGAGGDTILFAKGDGHDTLTNPSSGYSRNDTLQLVDI